MIKVYAIIGGSIGSAYIGLPSVMRYMLWVELFKLFSLLDHLAGLDKFQRYWEWLSASNLILQLDLHNRYIYKENPFFSKILLSQRKQSHVQALGESVLIPCNFTEKRISYIILITNGTYFCSFNSFIRSRYEEVRASSVEFRPSGVRVISHHNPYGCATTIEIEVIATSGYAVIPNHAVCIISDSP